MPSLSVLTGKKSTVKAANIHSANLVVPSCSAHYTFIQSQNLIISRKRNDSDRTRNVGKLLPHARRTLSL